MRGKAKKYVNKLQAVGWRGKDFTSQSEVLTETPPLAGVIRGSMHNKSSH